MLVVSRVRSFVHVGMLGYAVEQAVLRYHIITTVVSRLE